MAQFSLDKLVTALRAAGEDTRMRLLALCAQGEWTVSEIVQVIGQSQPRVSRHLKLLTEAQLLERFREGSWVFYRRAQTGEGARIARSLGRLLAADDPVLQRDRQRLSVIRDARRRAADAYFAGQAEAWDSEGDWGVPDGAVDKALLDLLANETEPSLLDIGTGTGRILQLLAPHIGFGLGIDHSPAMLSVARANLDRREAKNCQVRQGDMYALGLPDRSFSTVILHQVLHFADDPLAVLREAARVLTIGGRLIVVDLKAHSDESLRTSKQHRRLGFSSSEMAAWFADTGLEMHAGKTLSGAAHQTIVWHGTRCAAGASLSTTNLKSTATSAHRVA